MTQNLAQGLALSGPYQKGKAGIRDLGSTRAQVTRTFALDEVSRAGIGDWDGASVQICDDKAATVLSSPAVAMIHRVDRSFMVCWEEHAPIHNNGKPDEYATGRGIMHHYAF